MNAKQITVEIMGSTETMYNKGIGNYPYDCTAKRKYPNSTIYANATGGWVASHKLTKLPNGNYAIN